jgi:chorismate synthase
MILSIPAIKGIEFGSGFHAAKMKGSEHNDRLVSADGKTATNNAGGINGGITNGNDLVFRVPVKPTSSIHRKQNTIHMESGKMTDLEIEGRHDTCIALRMPVVIEAAVAIVLADLMMQAGIIARIWNK